MVISTVVAYALTSIVVLSLPVVLAVVILYRLGILNSRLLDKQCGFYVHFVFLFIGTVIHELSHALFCIIFRHKILEMEVLSYDPGSKSLGHVSHSWNRRSLYQVIGNFPIGIAPLITGLTIFSLYSRIFERHGVVTPSGLALVGSLSSYSASQLFAGFIGAIWTGIGQLFTAGNFTNIWYYGYIALSLIISISVAPSFSDLKNSFSDAIAFVCICIVATLVMSLFNIDIFSYKYLQNIAFFAMNSVIVLIVFNIGLLLFLCGVGAVKRMFAVVRV